MVKSRARSHVRAAAPARTCTGTRVRMHMRWCLRAQAYERRAKLAPRAHARRRTPCIQACTHARTRARTSGCDAELFRSAAVRTSLLTRARAQRTCFRIESLGTASRTSSPRPTSSSRTSSRPVRTRAVCELSSEAKSLRLEHTTLWIGSGWERCETRDRGGGEKGA
eukprot:4091137-Pleurochrysis_carterae.AAC.2